MPKGRELRDRTANVLSLMGSLDGAATRVRRGRVVVIPEPWLGQVTRAATIRKRQAKRVRKQRQQHSWCAKGFGRVDRERELKIEALAQRRPSAEPGHPRNWAPRLAPKRVRLLARDDEDA